MPGNSPVPGEFPAQRPVTRSFDVFFDLCPINDWVNNREAGDLRRSRAHNDVTVMNLALLLVDSNPEAHIQWDHLTLRREGQLSNGMSHWALHKYLDSKRAHTKWWYWHSFDFAHDDVIKWKHFPRYWPVKSPHKGQWRGASMFTLICAWTNAWVNNRDDGGLRRHCAHYDDILQTTSSN